MTFGTNELNFFSIQKNLPKYLFHLKSTSNIVNVKNIVIVLLIFDTILYVIDYKQ